MDRTKRLLSVTVLDRKHFKYQNDIFFAERLQKSTDLDNFSSINIMVVAKKLCIPVIFYFKESWKSKAFPEMWRSVILKRYKNISKQ